jgi:hypothetical protein
MPPPADKQQHFADRIKELRESIEKNMRQL